MSITLGPRVPESSGSSADWPLELSVMVTVSLASGALALVAVAVLLSIGGGSPAPALLHCNIQHRPLLRPNQTNAWCAAATHKRRWSALCRSARRSARGRCRGVGNAAQGLVAAEHFHDLEDRRRGGGTGQRCPQGLGGGA